MNTYIIGHKNPDTDSIASACALAELRKQTDPSGTYIAARSGNANNQTKYVFQRAELSLPVILKDVHPKAADIMTRAVVSVLDSDPLLEVFHRVENDGIRTVPVTNQNRAICGIVGEHELVNLFIQEAVDQRPIYHFDTGHIPYVIKGSVLHTGNTKNFQAAIMVGAMPEEQALERLNRAGSAQTMLVVGNRKSMIEFAVSQNLPAVVITGVNSKADVDVDFTGYEGWVFLSGLDSAETVRRIILATPVSTVMNTDFITLSEDDYVDSISHTMQQSRQRMLPVVSDGILIGTITRTNVLKRYKNRLILVDHNEAEQAVDGVETADVVEIVDHHRLGAVRTTSPVTYYAKPVGSTCTLVHQLYQSAGIKPSKNVAMLLMGGILSDTVILKSPTATKEDKAALEALSELAGVSWEEFGLDIFKATDNLKARSPENIITTDFKKYTEYGVSFGVGQVEVVTLAELDEAAPAIYAELERQKQLNGLDWALLLITDIIMEESVLLCTPFPAGEQLFTYRAAEPHHFLLPDVLSRKKQLLPEILRILEEIK